MMLNFKLFFKYVFFKINYSFINNLAQRSKNTNLCINNNSLFFACTHMKMSSSFYSTQLCDMFAYEILSPTNNKSTNDDPTQSTFKYNLTTKPQSTIIVYNFHSLHSQNRFFFFTQNLSNLVKSKFLPQNDSIDSIAELFPAAN